MQYTLTIIVETSETDDRVQNVLKDTLSDLRAMDHVEVIDYQLDPVEISET